MANEQSVSCRSPTRISRTNQFGSVCSFVLTIAIKRDDPLAM